MKNSQTRPDIEKAGFLSYFPFTRPALPGAHVDGGSVIGKIIDTRSLMRTMSPNPENHETMKIPSTLAIPLLLAAAPAYGQSGHTSASEDQSPRLRLSEQEVLSSRTTDLGERRVTFEEVSPLDLPSFTRKPNIGTETGAVNTATSTAGDKERKVLLVGGTVYIPNDDPGRAKTLVRFHREPDAAPVLIWVDANLMWLGGFAEYESAESVRTLMLALSEAPMDSLGRAGHDTENARAVSAPPSFSGETDLVVINGSPSQAELEPFRAMIGKYRADKARLRRAYEKHKAEREQERLRELENPPRLKDIRIRYWRTDSGRGGQG